ncbi:VOC family protein [Mycobacterium bourgelatii]|uniref:VOC family protein n=1 Tax=Mycobacterium bourgelatii TaxID=1273442 RepID=A0A7I9YPW9_MYCBU|nr:VOC family protein [Mycobacterium bourgelatii]GFG90726.1 VOC family protein [Mycobacterium bourgelatii]
MTTVQKVTTFLMFEGKAEEAMRFYTSLFADSEIRSIARYGPGDAGPEGTVQHATFVLAGQEFMCIDSPAAHGFTFTPSMSLYVQCDSDAEIERLFDALGAGGEVLMPLDAYPFSAKFGWVNDAFGVSWQLNFGDLSLADGQGKQ